MNENKSDNLTKNEGLTADTAEAGRENKAVQVPEKFKDVQTLIKAYSDLEAEFTRRSQRLKELESGNKAVNPSDGTESSPSQKTDEELIRRALSNESVRQAVIGDYLKSVSQSKAVPVISGGGGICAPRSVPASIKDAGRLAKQFLKN